MPQGACCAGIVCRIRLRPGFGATRRDKLHQSWICGGFGEGDAFRCGCAAEGLARRQTSPPGRGCYSGMRSHWVKVGQSGFMKCTSISGWKPRRASNRSNLVKAGQVSQKMKSRTSASQEGRMKTCGTRGALPSTRCLLRRHSLSQRDKLYQRWVCGGFGEGDAFRCGCAAEGLARRQTSPPGRGATAGMRSHWVKVGQTILLESGCASGCKSRRGLYGSNPVKVSQTDLSDAMMGRPALRSRTYSICWDLEFYRYLLS